MLCRIPPRMRLRKRGAERSGLFDAGPLITFARQKLPSVFRS
jgi:hypothetical protein